MSAIVSGLIGAVVAVALTICIAKRVGKAGPPGHLRFGVFMWVLGAACLAFALLPIAMTLLGNDRDTWAKVLLFVGFGAGAVYCFGEAAFVSGTYDADGISFSTPWTGRKIEKWKDLQSIQLNDWCSWYTLTFKSGSRVRLSRYLSGHMSALESAEEAQNVTTWNTTLPSPMALLHRLEFDYEDGMDFEPYDAFLSSSETSSWFKKWTGNAEASGSEFRVFGQDGTGGYAAFWLVVASADILQQPIVFLGSEGETGVVATNFDNYLWLLAGGIGPFEAVSYSEFEQQPNPAFARFAEQHSSVGPIPPAQVVANARAAHSGFKTWIESLCR